MMTHNYEYHYTLGLQKEKACTMYSCYSILHVLVWLLHTSLCQLSSNSVCVCVCVFVRACVCVCVCVCVCYTPHCVN